MSVNATTKRILSRDWQITLSSGLDVPGLYRHAIFADPQPSLLDQGPHAQAEIDRIAALYDTARWYYRVTVAAPPATRYKVGETVRLTYPAHGLSAGKKLMIVGVEYEPLNETARLTLWG